MKQILPLNKGMNVDANPIYVRSAEGEVLERRNCRVVSVNEGEGFVNVSLRGMDSIGTTTGLGAVMGYVEDKKRNYGIYFINDSIYAYRQDNDDVILIVQMPFVFSAYINAIVIGDKLVWTDNVNPIRCINIVRALNKTSNASVDWKETYQEITNTNTLFGIPTPTTRITASFGYDSLLISNLIIGKTFQFAYRYKYKDGEKGTISEYSDVYVHPSLIIYPETTGITTTENYLLFDIPLGDSEVVATELLVSENKGLWFIASTFKKELPTDTVITGYKFYNDTVREYITADIANLGSQSTPNRAAYVETAKNRIIFGNILANYNHPNISLTLSAVTNNVSTESEIGGVATGGITGSGNDKVLFFHFDNVPITDNRILSFEFDAMLDGDIRVRNDDNNFSAKYKLAYSVEYLIPAGATKSNVLDYIVAKINESKDELVYDIDVYAREDTSAVVDCLRCTAIRNNNSILIGFTATNGQLLHDINDLQLTKKLGYTRPFNADLGNVYNTFIDGSGYTVGIEYYDEVGGTSGVEGEEDISIPISTDLSGWYDGNVQTRSIRVEISGNAPSWAVKYRVVCTKSNSYSSVTSFLTAQTYQIYDGGKIVTAILMPELFDYQYNNGDFINWYPNKSYLQYRTGVRVIGQRATITINDVIISGNFLIVDSHLDVPNGYVNFDSAIVNVYRPLLKQEDKIFYHATPLYDCNITHSVTDITITSGDAYIIRSYQGWEAEKDKRIKEGDERFKYTTHVSHLSTILGSYTAANVGKPTTTLSDYKEVRLQELWYGGQIIENTGINDIRDFSNNGRMAVSESDGQIMGLKLVGDVLKVIQDNKETSVYIGKEQITNADGTMQLVSSQGYLGTVNRYNTDYGSIHPRSIVSNERDIYYFDHHNGQFIRSSPNGQFPISSYGFTSYFKNKAKQITNSIVNGLQNVVTCYYDRNYGEVCVVFNVVTTDGAYREGVVFNEAINGWTHFIDLERNGVQPDVIGTIGVETISFMGGTLWRHDRTDTFNSIYGQIQPLVVKSVVNVSPTQEKVLNAIIIDGNRGLDTIIETPISDNNVIGQKTILNAESYESMQGVFVSEIYQNIRTVNGDDLDMLYSGDDIQGRYITIELSEYSSNKVELRDIGVNILPER